MSLGIFKKGYPVCTATHPRTPNFKGNARGRSIHLVSRDKKQGQWKLTLCGMLMDEEMSEKKIEWTVYNEEHRQCRNCLKEADKTSPQPNQDAQNVKVHF